MEDKVYLTDSITDPGWKIELILSNSRDSIYYMESSHQRMYLL